MELSLQPTTFPSQANKSCLQREENERTLPQYQGSHHKPAKRLRWEEEGQRSVASSRRSRARVERSLSRRHRGVYRFRRGYGGGTSGRRRLTAIKRAIYKSNNNRQVAIAA